MYTDQSNATAAAPASLAESGLARSMQIALAALVGVFVVGMVGFSPMSVLHNATHDVRHSISFPCH